MMAPILNKNHKQSITQQIHKLVPIQRVKPSHCLNCKYFRIQELDQCHVICLLRDRQLCVERETPALAEDSVRYIVCNEWILRPSTWKVYNKMNPVWHDPYLKRYTLEHIREAVIRKLKQTR